MGALSTVKIGRNPPAGNGEIGHRRFCGKLFSGKGRVSPTPILTFLLLSKDIKAVQLFVSLLHHVPDGLFGHHPVGIEGQRAGGVDDG